MPNVLEFYIKMKDMMSSGLAKVAKTGKDSFGAIEGSVNKVYSAMQRAGESIDGYTNKLKNARSETERFSKSSGGLSIGGLVKGNLITDGIRQAIGGAGGFMQDSISKAMDFGKTKMSFEVLTGSKEKGQALSGDLNKLQQDTILGPEVFKNAQTMLGMGISAEKVLPNLKMLGDVSMGDAEKLGSLTLAFSQVSSGGKLTGQDLLQFINAGFNPLNEISKTTGISMAKLKEKMSDGAISTKMVEDAFKSATGEGGLYNNMLNKLAETPAGKLAQLQGQFEGFKVKLGEALMPLADVGLKWLTQMLELANQVIPYIVSGVNQVLNFVNGISSGTSEWSDYFAIAGAFVSDLWDGLKYIWQIVSYIVSDFVKWIKSSELMKDLFSALQKVGQLVWWVIKNIGYILQEIWTNVIKPILDGIEKAYRWVKNLLGFGKSEIQVTSKSVSEVKGTTPTLATGATASGGGKPGAGGSSASSSVANGIAKGGPRVININGVKFTDKIEIHTTTLSEGRDKVEEIFHDMFLRLLASGASVQ